VTDDGRAGRYRSRLAGAALPRTGDERGRGTAPGLARIARACVLFRLIRTALSRRFTSYYATRKAGERPWTLYDARGKVSTSGADQVVIDFPTLAELEDWISRSDLP
jgi:hypothetical protein